MVYFEKLYFVAEVTFKGASTKIFHHANRILAMKEVGGTVDLLKMKICDKIVFIR